MTSSGDALQRVLAALERVGSRWRHQSGGYVAQCPAHEDNTPSMTMKNGDGKVLVYCQAGCSTDNILASLGLHAKDLFDTTTAPSSTRRKIVATYDYHTAAGVVLYQKVRMFPKGFWVRHPDGQGGWTNGIGSDTPRVLYRLPEVLSAIRDGRTIYVCEGEKDADRVASLGHTTTTNYEGAAQEGQRPKWKTEYSDALAGAHVIVVADNDPAGYAHARAVVTSLLGRAASVKLVRPIPDFPKADVSDHLATGRTLDELVEITLDDALATEFESYPDPPPDTDDDPDGDPLERIHQYEVAQEVRKLRVRDEARRLYRAEQAQPLELPAPVLLTDLLAEPDEPAQYRIEGLMPAGGRVVLAAQYKAGKTTMIGNLIRCLADGGAFLGAHTVNVAAGRVVLVDNEMARETIKRWSRDQGIRYTDEVAIVPTRGNVGSFDVINPEVRKRWIDLIAAYDPGVLILDCLRPVLDALGLDENTDAGQILVALDEIATHAGASELIVVHHMGHSNERSRGSSRIRDWPDVEWRLVRKDPDDPSSQRFFTAYGRDVDVPETALEYDQATRHLTLVGGNRVDVSAHVLIPDLYDLVTDQPGLSGRAIEDKLMDAGVSRAVARAAINSAVDQGCVITVPGPKRSVLHHPSPSKSPERRLSAPVRHRSSGALAHSTNDSSAPEDQTTETAGHSSSAPVRRSAPTISGALVGDQCEGSVGAALSREPQPGALNTQVNGLVRRSSPEPGALGDDQALDASGDQWVHAHLTTTPQTLARLATDLDATTTTIETALGRLESIGHAQCHTDFGQPDGWSLPTTKEEHE